jgi:putative lipoprotein
MLHRARRHARRTILATLIVAAWPSRARAGDPDPWLGPDKALHFGASAVIAGGAYGVSATFARARYVRLLVGGGVALAAGAGKELYDLSGHGDPSWRDFTWDVLGTLVGLGVAWGIDLAIGGTDPRHPIFADPPAASAHGLTIRF